MINFEHTRVYNFMGAIRNMRNSWESWDKMDSFECHHSIGANCDVTCANDALTENFVFGPNDHELAMKLAKAGSDHAKFLRQILVSVDITAPEYWWKEQATYKVGTVENSTSMMHKLGSRLVGTDDFSFDDPTAHHVIMLVHIVNALIENWWESGKKKPSPEWRELIQSIPQSFNYRRGCTLNYQVLKNMYHARKTHRLQEWRDFCNWVESLPYSELITLKEVK